MKLFLGFDVGTQGIKAELIDPERGEIVGSGAVQFGLDLPDYHSPDGHLPSGDPLVRRADPRMWLDGMRLLLRRLAAAGWPLAEVAGLSGAAQQHGSVYLASRQPLQFSRAEAPIWLDRSTSAECRELEERFGKRLQQVTGSPAIERFTGPQIRHFAHTAPVAYAQTTRIHLVSSFLCSWLCGGDAPVDYGDGAGMNLLNLATGNWDEAITAFTAPGLLPKLPAIVPSTTTVGTLASEFHTFGLTPGIPVVVWSGDNPSSLIGVGGSTPGCGVVSLGTSDTLFAAMPEFRTDPDGYGHIFGNPAGGFMSLICFANGSLARERLREQCGVDRQFFDEGFQQLSPPGNDGKLLLPYFEPENTPLVLSGGVQANFDRHSASRAVLIRALQEAQALRMKRHSDWLPEPFSRLRVTGGASRSRGFRQIIADVFQVPVESIQVPDSAALGAALRAANAVAGIPFPELYGRFCRPVETVLPRREYAELYRAMLKNFADFERQYSEKISGSFA